MHDNKTLAFCIGNPLTGHKFKYKNGDEETFYDDLIQIWHADPSEDFCGWAYPRINEDLGKKLHKLGEEEHKFLFGEHGYDMSPLEAIFNVWQILAWRLHKRGYEKFSAAELAYIISLSSCASDNLRHIVQEAKTNEKSCGLLFYLVYRCYLKFHRPWYRHPKFHIHHWNINFVFMLEIKRFLFSRCKICGKSFKYGEAPVTDSWHSPGPKWFRGEQGVRHVNCNPIIIKNKINNE